jgi:hypothetical protein
MPTIIPKAIKHIPKYLRSPMLKEYTYLDEIISYGIHK